MVDDVTKRIIYRYRPISRTTKHKQQSIQVIGCDTEAYVSGKCFMIATSLGDVFLYSDFPQCMFNRKYKNTTFVTYNLSYDEGALLQWLPPNILHKLWEVNKVAYKDYVIYCIPKKMLRITKNKKDSITFYDMMNFYAHAGENGSSALDSVAKIYLNEQKLDIETKRFTLQYVKSNWDHIAKYCIHDAVLVAKLAKLLIDMFEEFGIFPRALYSVAYITFQYFYKYTKYVVVKRFWNNHRKLLNYAMYSYNGGKFEVTRKGIDHYYEYDIVSAYPHSIANLIDISHARITYNKRYEPDATYGFMLCILNIDPKIYSPVALKWGSVNIYPVGKITKVITKQEYDYLISLDQNIKILDAVYIHCDTDFMPYRERVFELFEYKRKYKEIGDYMRCHTVKILLNSLYGKFVQLIKKGRSIEASTCWNPIYGSIITANTRIAVSKMQQQYNSVVAVHTDSVISTKPLDITLGKNLGDWSFECEGDGVVLGCGIYQIGNITKARGFHLKSDLLSAIRTKKSELKIIDRRAISWREVAFHNYDSDRINRFEELEKHIHIRFDKKRIWINDYDCYNDIFKRNVLSVPHYANDILL